MQLYNVLGALMASTVMVMAAPAPEQGVSARGTGLTARGCPDGYNICGECNGTKCKVAGVSYGCDVGSCTSQSGGGDGQVCGILPNDDKWIHCPGTA